MPASLHSLIVGAVAIAVIVAVIALSSSGKSGKSGGGGSGGCASQTIQITTGNNVVQLYIGNSNGQTLLSTTIPVGCYVPVTLASTLQTAINSCTAAPYNASGSGIQSTISNPGGFSVSFDSTASTFTLQCPVACGASANNVSSSNLIWPTLGIALGQYYQNTITSTSPIPGLS